MSLPPSSPPREGSSRELSDYATTQRSNLAGLLPGFVPSSPSGPSQNERQWSAKLHESLKTAGPVLKHTLPSNENAYDDIDDMPPSSPPGLPSFVDHEPNGKGHVASRRLHDLNDMNYPTPAPTSSLGLRSSSPPLAPYVEEEIEEDDDEDDTPNQREQFVKHFSKEEHTSTTFVKKTSLAEFSASFENTSSTSKGTIIRIPKSGGEVTVGRSSQSCDFALSSKNKLISRVHVCIAYFPVENSVTFTCVGWNGCKVTVPEFITVKSSNLENSEVHGDKLVVCETVSNGFTDYILPKGQQIEVNYVEGISIDVRGEYATLEIDDSQDQTFPETSKERSPLKPIFKDTISNSSNAVPKEGDNLKKSNASEEKEISLHKAALIPSSLFKAEISSTQPENEHTDTLQKNPKISTPRPWEKPPSEPSLGTKNLNHRLKEAPLPKKSSHEMMKVHSPGRRHPTTASLPKKPSSSFPFKELGKKKSHTEDSQLHKRTSSAALLDSKLPSTKRVAADNHASDVNTPRIKLVARALIPKEEAPAISKAIPLDPPKVDDSIEVPNHDTLEHTPIAEHIAEPTNETTDSQCDLTPEALDKEIANLDLAKLSNLICNHLAFSRLSSTPLSTLRASSPSLGPLSKKLLRHLLRDGKFIPSVGVIYRQGKDAAGKPLEEEYYYMAENDTDADRKAMVEQLRGRGGGLRACRKTHKQYFWKKPAK